MDKLKGLLAGLSLALMIGGCTGQAALVKGQSKIDLSSDAVALLAVRISNQNKPDYQPFPFMVFMRGGVVKFDEDGPHRSEPRQFNEYLLSFNLAPGSNRFDKIWLDYHGTFVGARASIPLHLVVDIKPNAVQYLGCLNVVIRPKQNDQEDSAGATLPLIDQATAGFSNGAYDVKVEDRFDEDMNWFNAEYPVLRNMKVDKNLLPQWVRPE